MSLILVSGARQEQSTADDSRWLRDITQSNTSYRRDLRQRYETGEFFNHKGHAYVVARLSRETTNDPCCFRVDREDIEPDCDQETNTSSSLGLVECEAHADDDLEHDG